MAFFPISLITLAAAAPAQAQPTLPPTEKWVAEYADDMCLLQRNYGTHTKPLILAFRPQPTNDYLTAWVFSPDAHNPAYVDLRAGFGGDRDDKRPMASFFSRKLKLQINEFSVSREELEQAARSGAISLYAKGRISGSFRVPELAKGLAVLDDCVADLLASWGFSREQQADVSAPAKLVGPVSRYVSSFDYPMPALKEGETGDNSARFHVYADGRTGDCKIVESSRSHSLDSAICQVVGRFRYKPALNRSGQPMQTIGFVRIRWQLM
jgi:TonB family protein